MKRTGSIMAALLVLGGPSHVAAVAGDCTANGKLKVVVELQTPPPQPAAGLKMVLRYPSAVALPGDGQSATVKARVADLPNGFMSSLNDLDGTFSVALASGTETASTGKLFTIEFDRCEGSAAPSASDFSCEVEEAVQDCGAPAGDVHCSVKIP